MDLEETILEHGGMRLLKKFMDGEANFAQSRMFQPVRDFLVAEGDLEDPEPEEVLDRLIDLGFTDDWY